MVELFRTAQVVGLRSIMRLYQAHRLGWKGIISGFYTTRTMQALFNVGFFDELRERGTVNAEAFAQSHGLDAEILKSLCESLYALRILKKDSGDYTLDAKGRILVEVAQGWFDGVYGYETIFHSLEALLRQEKVYGRDVKRRPQFVAKGSAEIERWIHFPLVKDYIRRKGFRKVLDLGCGDASFLIELCESNGEVMGYGIDIAPEAIASGRERVRQAGLEGRIHLFAGDICKLEEAPGDLRNVDAATTFFVLHEILFASADRVAELLRSFRRLFPGICLIVVEVIKPTPEEMRKRPGMAVQYFLQHELTNQKPVSRGEWRALFEASGFNSIEERHLRFARTSIFVVR